MRDVSHLPLLRRWAYKILERLGVPVLHYVDGPYVDLYGASVFPRQNLHMLTVAPDVGLQDTYINLQAPITIEEGVVFGHQVMLATGKHEVDAGGVRLETSTRGPILIKRRAWLASRCIILGGVTIGEGAVVGAGAVVTKDVPDHEFWAGNPAKFIKRIEDDAPVEMGE